MPDSCVGDALSEQLEERLVEAIGVEVVDRFPDGDGISVATDEWTLHFAADGSIWLAIDLEPDDTSQLGAAWRSALGPVVEDIFVDVNRICDGAMANRLAQSPDPLSNDLAGALRERAG